MKAGDTFLRGDHDSHLWVVISDPSLDPDNVLLVNFTTFEQGKERACILNSGEHPWVTHETCVNYEDSVVTTLEKLHSAKDGGAIRLLEPLTADLLRRIRVGVLSSERMALEKANILFDQGLFDHDIADP